MFFKGVAVPTAAAADNEVEEVSSFSALAGAWESFLQLAKRAAAVATKHRRLLKREFRVVLCVIDVYCFQCKNLLWQIYYPTDCAFINKLYNYK